MFDFIVLTPSAWLSSVKKYINIENKDLVREYFLFSLVLVYTFAYLPTGNRNAVLHVLNGKFEAGTVDSNI